MFCLHICIYIMCTSGVWRGQRRAWAPLAWELWMVVGAGNCPLREWLVPLTTKPPLQPRTYGVCLCACSLFCLMQGFPVTSIFLQMLHGPCFWVFCISEHALSSFPAFLLRACLHWMYGSGFTEDSLGQRQCISCHFFPEETTMLLSTLEKCLSGGTYGYLKRDSDRLGPIKCSRKLRFLVFLNCTRVGQHWKGMGSQREQR